MRVNPDQGLQFAQMLVQDEETIANINQVMRKPAHSTSPYKLPSPHVPFYRSCEFTLSHMHSSTKCPVWEPQSALFQMCQQCKEFPKSGTSLPFLMPHHCSSEFYSEPENFRVKAIPVTQCVSVAMILNCVWLWLCLIRNKGATRKYIILYYTSCAFFHRSLMSSWREIWSSSARPSCWTLWRTTVLPRDTYRLACLRWTSYMPPR